MELVKKICSKAEFESILNKGNVLCQFVSFLDAFNEHNFIYMVKRVSLICLKFVREVAFLTEDEMLKELVKLDNNSILNTFINKAYF